jgi:hypothetical protein
MEKQQGSEVSTTEIFDEPQLNGMDDFIFSDRMEANVATNAHVPSVQSSGKVDKPLEHHSTPDSTPALTFDGSLDFTSGSDIDMSVQPIHQRQDSAMEPKLFDDLFLPNLPDPCINADISIFDAQGSLSGAVDLEASKKSWPPPLLDLSELICADLYYAPANIPTWNALTSAAVTIFTSTASTLSSPFSTDIDIFASVEHPSAMLRSRQERFDMPCGPLQRLFLPSSNISRTGSTRRPR